MSCDLRFCNLSSCSGVACCSDILWLICSKLGQFVMASIYHYERAYKILIVKDWSFTQECTGC